MKISHMVTKSSGMNKTIVEKYFIIMAFQNVPLMITPSMGIYNLHFWRFHFINKFYDIAYSSSDSMWELGKKSIH